MRAYSDVAKEVTLEASASGEEWQWVHIDYGKEGSSSYRNLAFSLHGCRTSTIQANTLAFGQFGFIQTSCSAEFCRNLNAGKTPTVMGAGHFEGCLDFKDGSGNIEVSKLEATKVMCEAAASLL